MTVYLSLILCVMISLIFAALDSARLSCGRAAAALAAEEGLFSLFGEYDRMLYEKYGVLMVDGGYGSSELKAGVLMNEAAGITEKALSQGTLFPGANASNIFRADIDSKAVTGYILATDSGGQMLKEQIKSLMIEKIGLDAAAGLITYFSGAASAAETAESFDIEKMDSLKTDLEENKTAADEARKAAEEAASSAAESGGFQAADESENENAGASGTDVPESVSEDSTQGSDIIDNIYALKKLGIMAAAVPDLKSISSAQIPVKNMPSNRKLLTGMGELPKESSSALEPVLLSKYLTDFFPAFTDNANTDFRYQVEYVIAGKAKDADNLKSVLNRLLAIRMAMNYAYLISDPEKAQEAGALAVTIAAVLLIPEFYELVRQIILMCWSYGESMLDLKRLLAGGKVPLLKDDASWRSSLSGLASLSAETAGDSGGSGLNYKEYLNILLILKGTDRLMGGIEDLLEYSRRTAGGTPGFSIDTCVCSMEIQYEGCIGAHSFVLTRRYGYDKISL